MERSHRKKKSKMPKIASILPISSKMDDHSVISVDIPYYHHSNCNSPIFDPYAENLDMSPLIVRYFQSRSPVDGTFSTTALDGTAKNRSPLSNQHSSNSSGTSRFGHRGKGSVLSPLSGLENLETPRGGSRPMYGTAVKVDEDVLVMDGILVGSASSGARTMRSASDKSVKSDSSGAGGGGSLSSSGKIPYKTEICVSWENSGSCFHGSKCQLAHGKEVMCATRLPIKNKLEIGKLYTTCGTERHFGHQIMAATETETAADRIASFDKPEHNKRAPLIAAFIDSESSTTQITSPINRQKTNLTTIATITCKEWSPGDDGILVILPYSSYEKISTREDVNAHIDTVLYCSTSRRLPVFAKLCPD